MWYKLFLILECLVSLICYPFQNLVILYDYWNIQNRNIIDGYTVNQENVFAEGFCIKGDLTNSFIKKMLVKLNVSNQESQAFLKQLPQSLASSSYNLIYFDTSATTNLTIILKPVSTYISLPRQDLIHLSNHNYQTVNFIRIPF